MTKQEILAEIQLSRTALARDFSGLRREFDFQAKIKNSIRRNATAWLSGAVITGFLFSRRPAAKASSRRKSKDEATLEATTAKLGTWGLLMAMAKWLLPIVRPMLSAYSARKIAELATKLSH